MACQTARTQYVRTPDGVDFAYRRFGKATGVPMVFSNCFRANMDWWDPLLLNTIAEFREVIIFDGQGVGHTSGEVQPSYQAWANDLIALVTALALDKVDLFGYSMGARTVQFTAYIKPDLVRKMVLAGASPLSPSAHFTDVRNTKYMMAMATAQTPEQGKEAFKYALFSDDSVGIAAFDAYWSRLEERSAEPPMLEQVKLEPGGRNQIEAIGRADQAFTAVADDPLKRLQMPILVANGNNDLTVSTARSINLFERLGNAQLIIYPKSGHGFLWQYAKSFGNDVTAFLNREF